MKACVIMSLDDYEDICACIVHSIHVLDHKRVSAKDREDVVRALNLLRRKLEMEEI